MVALLVLLLAMAPVAQAQPPRDRPATPRTAVTDPALREAELQKRIADSPRGVAAYRELAKLQEDRGAFDEAELTLVRARQAVPESKDPVLALAALYNRDRKSTRLNSSH